MSIKAEHVTAIAAGTIVCAVLAMRPAKVSESLTPTCAKPVTVEVLHDGDTITKGSIDLGWGRSIVIGPDGEAAGIRAAGYDAWEVTKGRRTVEVTDDEIRKGIKARDALGILISGGQGQLYAEDSGQRDPYGRISAVLWVKQGQKWIYLAGWMEQQGHLRTPRK